MGRRIGAEVQAILYIHAEDGKEYVHVFGGREPTLKTDARGYQWMRVDNLPRRTDVELNTTSRDDKLTVQHTKGHSLSAEF